jgi:hypothetical protein
VHVNADSFFEELLQQRGLPMQSTLLRTESAMAEEAPKQENSAVKTKRLTQQSRFWLKEAMAQHGDSEAFLHWLRSDGAKHA